MTSNTLKVDCTSHCTTPSEPQDPSLVSVKVGCFHVNPATPRGRRKFLLQMLVLCFVPHAALIIQNSTIMAQLMQTLDSAFYLSSEVETILSLGDLILALQDERQEMMDFLFMEPTRDIPNRTTLEKTFAVTDDRFDHVPANVKDHREIALYHFRNDIINFIDLKKEDSYRRVSVYEEINSVLLLYSARRVKVTANVLWRQLLASQTLTSASEEVSLSLTSFIYHARFKQSRLKERETMTSFQTHRYSAINQLTLANQCMEIEHLEIEAKILDEITAFFKQTSQIESTSQDVGNYIRNSREYLERLRDVQTSLIYFVRDAVSGEMWVARRTLFIAALILVLVVLAAPVLVLLLRHTIYTIQTFTHSIEVSTQRLMAEKQKSDMLLSRMLPLPVLKRLRAQRTVPAESFDAVTIFFSDIVGFTTISANSTPMEVINMLNMLYRLFDQKIMQYNVYKVETIGDAYMVVSGLPQRNGNKHASEIADMSLSLMRSLEGATVPHRPRDTLRIRAGVNTGPCVAGVVGTTMPRYCLFGDTINTASRMESTGEAMKIHISHTTKKALEEIGNYEMISRGILDVAGKGTMETYWLVDKIGGLQEDSPDCRLHDYGQNLLEMIIGP